MRNSTFRRVIYTMNSTPPPPSTDFIIKVKTDNDGTSEDNQFTLPLINSVSIQYDCVIDWGDGNNQSLSGQSSAITHTYSVAGEYTIKISGDSFFMRFSNSGDRRKVIELVNLGDVGWFAMNQMFFGCTEMIINENCRGEFQNVTTVESCFNGCTKIDYIPPMNLLICTNFSSFIEGTSLLKNIQEIETGSGVNFSRFAFNSGLEIFPIDFDFSNATNLSIGFANCKFKDIPAVDFPICTNFSQTFFGLGVIDSCGLRNFYAMTNGAQMFNNTTLPTSDWSDILVTQRANNANTGVTFHGGSSKYNPAGGVAREELVTIQSWSIIDGGAE